MGMRSVESFFKQKLGERQIPFKHHKCDFLVKIGKFRAESICFISGSPCELGFLCNLVRVFGQLLIKVYVLCFCRKFLNGKERKKILNLLVFSPM